MFSQSLIEAIRPVMETAKTSKFSFIIIIIIIIIILFVLFVLWGFLCWCECANYRGWCCLIWDLRALYGGGASVLCFLEEVAHGCFSE